MEWFKKIFILSLIITVFPLFSRAGEEKEHEGFNPIEYILDHVEDSHEWDFFSVGDKHFSIPLPVLLYSKHSGWHFFSSTKLDHPEEGFNFYVAKGGINDRKIFEKLEDGSEIIPLDLSLTKTVLGCLFVALFMLVFLIQNANKAKKNVGKAPKGSLNVAEMLVLFVREEIAKPFAGKNYAKLMPYLLTLFTFVLLTNAIGLLIPLGINVTGNIAVTATLAAITFFITSFSGNKHYWGHIFNPEVPIYMKLPVPFMPFIELVGIFIKPIVLMIRLFSNMIAGHMIIAVLVGLIFLMSSIVNPLVGAGTSIISVAFSVFMLLIDILVAFIQAYIFALLSALYYGMATDNSEH